jgi:hypothetical protein
MNVLAAIRRLHRALGLKYHADRMVRWVRRFGFPGAFLLRRRLSIAGGKPVEVQVPGLPHPVVVRSGTADLSTFEHIFIWEAYDLEYPTNVRNVVDAGANTGLAAAYFANRFPDATIISLEPESANFSLLERNTAAYRNVIPLHAALWREDTTL